MLGKLSYSVAAAGLVNIPGLTVGAITANSLAPSFFSNEADTVAQNNSYTPLQTKYLIGSDQNHFSLKTLGSYRDVEASGWSRRGRVYLRLDSAGKAIYFDHNGTTASGTLEIGIATGVDETSYAGTPYALYRNANLVSTVTGYTQADTTGQYFTFGVQGFDIYVKYNGVEFLRFKEYRQMNAGVVGFKASDVGSSYGWRGDNSGNITVTPLLTKHLYSSRYAFNELDLRDFGLRSIQTKGTISAASNSLAIAARQAFQVGDWVIVEIGAEPGAGARGTIGVGGVWPALYYTNSTSMNADTGQAVNTFAWTQNDGTVYQWSGSGWTTSFAGSTYYTAKAIPYSLHGRITSISADGLTLTLVDQDGNPANASVSATNANVYLDNQPYVNYLTAAQKNKPGQYADLTPITPLNQTIIFPSGAYAGSGKISLLAQASWTLKGQGQGSTTLFAPKGVYGLNIVSGALFSGYTIRDLTLTGNWGLNQYGLATAGWTYIPGGLTNGTIGSYLPQGLMPSNPDNDDNGSWLTATAVPNALMFTPGIFFAASHNGIVQDVTINDVSQKAVGSDRGNNVWAYRVTNNQTSPRQDYIQWQFQWANSTGGGAVDCTVNSPYLIEGFSGFQALNTSFIRATGNNAYFSLNDCGGWVIQDSTASITATTYPAASWSPTTNVVAIDGIAGYDLVGTGGTLSNMTITISNYIGSNNDIPTGIVVDTVPNVTITGGSYTALNYAAPSTLVGPCGIVSTGSNTTSINNFTSRGTVHPGLPSSGYANIVISGGSVINSAADTAIVVAGVSIPTGTNGNTIPVP